MDFFEKYDIAVGEKQESPFLNKYDIYQDGTTPMYRDVDGRLWAMSGHSHMGHIGMFCGTTLADMKEVWPISTNFCVGHAEYAFSGIRYPEGILPRGSIWPFGLYICPNTHRFFCFFHNEGGWNGKGTAYDAFGYCKTPAFDSDFRHVGLMHSDDEGKNWIFDRWVLTGEQVAFTEKFNPGAGVMLGQKSGSILLGSGDFSIFVEPEGDYIYLFYNIIRVHTENRNWESCDVYVARTRKRTDGVMGDFVKYYDGAFCEAGNFGKETMIVEKAWHPRVMYSKKYNKYFMSAVTMRPPVDPKGSNLDNVMAVRVSDDMLHWSEPLRVRKNGEEFGNHYVAMVSDDPACQPNIAPEDAFVVLTNHNGTDVAAWPAAFVEK